MKKHVVSMIAILIVLCSLIGGSVFLAGDTSLNGGGTEDPSIETPVSQNATWQDAAATSFAGGTGTATDPYLIATPAQLGYLALAVNSGVTFGGKYFLQTADLNLSANAWLPIGGAGNSSFLGNFNGNGYYITGLVCTSPTTSGTALAMGFFGAISGGAVVQNVTLRAPQYTMATTGATYIYFGGIVGFAGNSSDIRNCVILQGQMVNTTVARYRYMGGIVGCLQYSSVIECQTVDLKMGSSGLTSSSSYAGGIVGSARGKGTSVDLLANIISCSYLVTKTGVYMGLGTYTSVGGIVGEAQGTAIDMCYSNPSVGTSYAVMGLQRAGGIVGVGQYLNIYSCFSTVTESNVFIGDAPATSTNFGGIIGYDPGTKATFTYCCHMSTYGVPGKAMITFTDLSLIRTAAATEFFQNSSYLGTYVYGSSGAYYLNWMMAATSGSTDPGYLWIRGSAFNYYPVLRSVYHMSVRANFPTINYNTQNHVSPIFLTPWSTNNYAISGTIPTNVISAMSGANPGFRLNGWNLTPQLTETPAFTTKYSGETTGFVMLYTNWVPIPTNIEVKFAVENDVNGTVFDVVDSVGGCSFNITYKTTRLSGEATASSTLSNLNSCSLTNVLSLSTINLTTTVSDSYVYIATTNYTAAQTSITSSYAGSANSSVGSNVTAGSGASVTTYIYILVKRLADAQLMYDPIGEYYYFEDGMFPQTAVCTYDSGFEELLNGLVAEESLQKITTLDGQTIKLFTWEAGLVAGYDGYIGQRFAGYTPTITRTIKLNNPVPTSYTFNAGQTYWFKFEPIKWRVTDIRAWGNIGNGMVYSVAFYINSSIVSDVLWWDCLEADDSMGQGNSAMEYDIFDFFYDNSSTFFGTDASTALEYDRNAETNIDNSMFVDSTMGISDKVVTGNGSSTTLLLRPASLKEIKSKQSTLECYGSQLACVMAGVSQNIPLEYWTRDLGQTIGNGTYVTRSGQVIKSSGYNQSKGIRFATTFSETSHGKTVEEGSVQIVNSNVSNNAGSTTGDYLSYNATTKTYTWTRYAATYSTLSSGKTITLEAGKKYKMYVDVDVTTGTADGNLGVHLVASDVTYATCYFAEDANWQVFTVENTGTYSISFTNDMVHNAGDVITFKKFVVYEV